MEDMIKKIIAIDRHAREITEAAVEQKLQAEKDISQAKAKLREDYLQRANERLKRLEQEHRQISEESFQENKRKYDESLEQLASLDSSRHAEWVDQLVKQSLA